MLLCFFLRRVYKWGGLHAQMMTKAWLSARQQNVYPLGSVAANLPAGNGDVGGPPPRRANDEAAGGGAADGGEAGDEAAGGGTEVRKAPAQVVGGTSQGRPTGPPADPPPPAASGAAAAKPPWKPADFDTTERRIDDARALIPYLFGAFKHPNRHGLRLGLPMLQYCNPEIDLKTGKWRYHATETLDLIAKVLKVSDDLAPWGLLVHIDDSGADTTALSSVLNAIDKTEKKIEKLLVKHKVQIVKNYTVFRKAVINCVAEELSRYAGDDEEDGGEKSDSAWNEITQALRVALINENAAEVKANESLNLKGSFGHPNEAFGGSYLFDDILSTLKNRKTEANKPKMTAVYAAIHEQEESKMESIILTIRCIRRVYRETIKALDTGDDVMQSFRNALLKSPTQKTSYPDTKAQNKSIDDYISNLLAERVELLYCNIYTFFSVMIGKNHKEISKMSLSLVNAVMLSAFFPTLKAQYYGQSLSDVLLQGASQKSESTGQSLLRQLYEEGTAARQSHIEALFQINPGDSTQHVSEISLGIIDAIWNKSDLRPVIRQPINLNQIFLHGQLAYAQKHVGEISIMTTKVKTILSSTKARLSTPSASAVSYANDLLFGVLQQRVAPTARRRFSFNILSHAIYADQRSNPYFTVSYILDRSSIRDVNWAAKCFFERSSSPFLEFHKAQHTALVEQADPFATTWIALPTAQDDLKPAWSNSFIKRLALRNVDAISSFTASGKAKQAQNPKKQAAKKNKKAPPKPAAPIKKKADSEKKKKNQGKKPASTQKKQGN